jgi:twitching motility protein PilT
MTRQRVDPSLDLSDAIPEDELSFKDVAPGGPGSGGPAPVPLEPPRPHKPAEPARPPMPQPARPTVPVQPSAGPQRSPEPPATDSMPAASDAEESDRSAEGEVYAQADPALRAILNAAPSSPRHQLEAWLAIMTRTGASDLILRAGGRPSRRVDGKIGFLPGRVPNAGALLEVLDGILGERRMDQWRENGSADAALHLDGLGRFRLNAYKQMGEPAVVIRRINEDAPDIDTLELPADSLKSLSLRKRGLILVTGIAGSGKSTTLASMIQYMNQTVERHIVTLEDPIELLFTEERCVISQREVGTDCVSFQEGLRNGLRQSPDVILIGEMRDAETVIAALDATETGHLVMSTLHTVNAPQTVDRILSFFSPAAHAQVRARLADNLAGVLSQRLIPRTGGKGLIPAFELMVSTPHVRELLLEGNTIELAKVIDQGTERGLVSFNQCLRRLVKEQKVDLNDALAASDRPEELVLALRGITASSARVEARVPTAPSGAEGLRMAPRRQS